MFFFHEKTVTAGIYLDTPTDYVVTQLEFQQHFFFQQTGLHLIGEQKLKNFWIKNFSIGGLEEVGR